MIYRASSSLFRLGLLALLGLAALFISIQPSQAQGTVIYVYVNATGSNNGTSWANAYVSLQSGLSQATSGNEIWVATGTYTPTTGVNRTVAFAMKKGVAIYGGFAATETLRSQRNWNANPTTLSGNIGATNLVTDNSYHVVTSLLMTSSAVLDGFIVSGGHADGAIATERGAGMYHENGSPTLSNLVIRDNSADGTGGGLYNRNNSNPSLTNVIFRDNTANYGGGIYNYFSDPKLHNVLFWSNEASRDGGGIFNFNSDPLLVNLTFSDNKVGSLGETFNGSGIFNDHSNPIIRNTILWGNIGGTLVNNPSSAPDIAYSIVEGIVYTGTGNLNVDPRFNNALAGDFRLQQDSLAVDAGNNLSVTTSIDLAGAARLFDGNGDTLAVADMGAHESQVMQHSNLSIHKSVSQATSQATAAPAQPITYTLVFSNLGATMSENVLVSDLIPAQLTNLAWQSSGITLMLNPGVAYGWSVPMMPANSSGIITVTGVMPGNVTSATTITNTATISAASESNLNDNLSAVVSNLVLPSITIADATRSEGDSGQQAMLFTVTLSSANPYTGTQVSFATSSGSATAGSDFVNQAGVLFFAAGVTQQIVSVMVVGDVGFEATETFTVTLSNLINATSADLTATGTINNDDDQPLSELTLQSSSPTTLSKPTFFTATLGSGTNVTYTWDFGDGSPVLTNTSNTSQHLYTATGIFMAVVTASNRTGNLDSTQQVDISNLAPTADAGAGQSVAVNQFVQLNGSASGDADGHLPLSFNWVQTGGEPVGLNTPTISMPSFLAPSAATVITFSLIVSDAMGAVSISDGVVITIGASPVPTLTPTLPLTPTATATHTPSPTTPPTQLPTQTATPLPTDTPMPTSSATSISTPTTTSGVPDTPTQTPTTTQVNPTATGTAQPGTLTSTSTPIASNTATATPQPPIEMSATVNKEIRFTAALVTGTPVTFQWDVTHIATSNVEVSVPGGANFSYNFSEAGVYRVTVTATSPSAQTTQTFIVTVAAVGATNKVYLPVVWR